MSKEVKEELKEVKEELKDVEQTNVQESQQISIQIADIVNALRIIEVAIERSTFKAPELVEVMPIYQKLLAFAQEVQKSEQEKGE